MKQPATAENPKTLRLRAEAAWELAGEAVARDFARGHFDEALQALETRIGRGCEEGWVYALRSEIKRSSRLDLYGEALEDAEKACRLSPDCFWIWGYAARAFAQARRPEQTLKHLEKALALEPDCPWLLVERSLTRLEQGRRAEALADAEAACRLAPRSRRAQLARAACLSSSARFDEALEILGGCAKLSDDHSIVGGASPQLYALRFHVLARMKRFAEAARNLKTAAASGERLAWAHAETSDERILSVALREIPAASAVAGLESWLGFWRGEILLRLKRFGEAEIELTRAVAADGKFFFARAWRAWCRSIAGRPEQALEDADAALRLMDKASPWAGQLFALKGSLCCVLGRFPEAESALTKALEHGGPQAWACLNRAQARLGLGKVEQSAADLDEALDADPAYGKAYVLRAQLRGRRGNLEGARSDLYRAKSVGKPRGDGPGLSLSFPAAVPADVGRDKPVQARRLGAVAVEPMIELVGLMQAVLAPKPFHIDAVSPLGEVCGSRDPLNKMPATAGLKEGPAIAKDMQRYAEEAVNRFASRIDAPMRENFQRAVAIQGNAASPWYGLSQMMMSVTDLPEMRVEGPEWRHPENLRLLESFRSFAGRFGFLEFISENKGSFSKWTKAIKETVAKEAYSEAVAAYVGVDINAYYDVVLSPLLRDVTLCAILKSNGLRGARTVICPLTHVSEFYRAYDKDYLLWRGWHEILHMVVDRWTELHIDDISPLSRLHGLPQGGAKRHDWRDCVAEHMVRAATQRILGLRRGTQSMEVLAGRDRLEGYIFQDRLAAALSVYESSRNIYPTLLDFFPEWLKVLKQWP